MARRQAPTHKPPKLPRQRPGPEGGVRDRNRHDNLRRLCEAGLGLFLADGTAAVSIDDIVGVAGMAKGSFYRYVSDKSELVAQIIGPVATEVAHAIDRCETSLRAARPGNAAARAHGGGTIDAIYMQLALELAQIIAAHPTRVLLYLQEARAPRGGARGSIHALADQLTARAVALTEIAREHRLVRDVDPRVVALAVIGAIDGVLFAILRGAGTSLPAADAAAIVRELVGVVLHGIRR